MEHVVNPQNLHRLPGFPNIAMEIDDKAVVRVFYRKGDGTLLKVARLAKADGLWVYGEAAPMLGYLGPAIQDVYNIYFGPGPY